MALEEEKIISVSNAAELCNVNRATIWRWIKIGELKAAKTAGGHYRIIGRDLLSLIRDKKMDPQFRAVKPGKRILVVDDDPDILKLFKRALLESDYTMAYAPDGFDAGLKIASFKPDLVFLDLFLPNMDGFEVCRRLRETPETCHIKIVAMTGYDTEKNKKTIMDLGADSFLPKPLDSECVLEETRRYLT